jgi:hypothetical protein
LVLAGCLLGAFFGACWVLLGACWVIFLCLLGACWVLFFCDCWVLLGACWVLLGACWVLVGCLLGACWVFFLCLLGQNHRNICRQLSRIHCEIAPVGKLNPKCSLFKHTPARHEQT